MGNYNNGKFNLILSLRYNANGAERDLWKESMQKASELLYAATDGQQQLGKIFVCNNSTGGKNADAWLFQAAGTSSSNARIWQEFSHAQWMNDEKYKPFILVHEMGHYLYALGDEYKTSTGGSANCQGDANPPHNACIMERGWSEGDRFGDDGAGGAFVEGETTDFCCPDNHDLGTGDDDVANDTVQSTRHGESCWQTIVDTYPDVTLPDGIPDEDRPDDFDDIEWKELGQELRFVLVVDRSGSMSTDGAKPMEEAIYGSSFWADSALAGDFLGAVGFNHGTTSHPLTEILSDANRDAVAGFIADLFPSGTTAMGDALRKGMEMIQSAGDPSATQIIVLFSDGKHNTGEDPLDVIDELVEHGIRVYTVGFGPYVDEDRLTAIAEATGGRYYPIDSTLDMTAAEAEIRNTLINLSAEVRDDGGIVTSEAGILDEENSGEHKVWIEEDSEWATFAVSWRGPVPLDIQLFSPSGRHIDYTTTDPDVRYQYRGMPYRLIQIRRPEPGMWKYKLGLSKKEYKDGYTCGNQAISYNHYVFSDNQRVSFTLCSPRKRYGMGEPITVLGQASSGMILTGHKVSGHIIGPRGDTRSFELFDEPQKSELFRVKGCGVYSNVFLPDLPGLYTIVLTADNLAQKAIFTQAGDSEKKEQGKFLSRLHRIKRINQAPAFLRTSVLTVRVGPVPTRDGKVEPGVVKPGFEGKLRLKLKNIPWVPKLSRLYLGRGITVREVSSGFDDSPTFEIAVSKRAKPGFRDLVVATGDCRDKLEGALLIDGKEGKVGKIDKNLKYRPGWVMRQARRQVLKNM
ncbi:MAG TPA: VWA domain-containing protein [bacterium]|nr:VWA domain-containing protein [bacterium]